MKRIEKLNRVFCGLGSDQTICWILPASGNINASRSTGLYTDLSNMIPVISFLLKKAVFCASKESSVIHSLNISSLFLDHLSNLEPEKHGRKDNDGNKGPIHGRFVFIAVNLHEDSDENQNVVDTLREESDQPVLKPNRVPTAMWANVLFGWHWRSKFMNSRTFEKNLRKLPFVFHKGGDGRIVEGPGFERMTLDSWVVIHP